MKINSPKTAHVNARTGAKTAHESFIAQVARTAASTSSACISADYLARHTKLIAESAYFAAEKRNFTGGDPIQDWLVAEREVCSQNP